MHIGILIRLTKTQRRNQRKNGSLLCVFAFLHDNERTNEQTNMRNTGFVVFVTTSLRLLYFHRFVLPESMMLCER